MRTGDIDDEFDDLLFFSCLVLLFFIIKLSCFAVFIIGHDMSCPYGSVGFRRVNPIGLGNPAPTMRGDIFCCQFQGTTCCAPTEGIPIKGTLVPGPLSVLSNEY